MGAGKMYRVNKKNGQTSGNYGGGHTGKGKKGASHKRTTKSVYAAGSHSVLKKAVPSGMGFNGVRVNKSKVMNPITYGVVYEC